MHLAQDGAPAERTASAALTMKVQGNWRALRRVLRCAQGDRKSGTTGPLLW
jgi:hypothetical protein